VLLLSDVNWLSFQWRDFFLTGL